MSASNLYSLAFGSTSSSSFPGNAVIQTRNPGSTDIKGPQGIFPVGQLWVNTVAGSYWGLIYFTSSNGVVSATWGQFTTGDVGGIKTINSLLPDGAGDFEIAAGSGITVTPGTNSISIATDGSHTTYNANTGSATPSSDVINVVVASDNGTLSVEGSGNTLSLTTSTAGYSTAFGLDSLQNESGGGSNSCFGTSAGRSITLGNYNTCVGLNSGINLTIGYANLLAGSASGNNLVSGSYNILFGNQAGSAYTTSESNNIIVGSSVSGTLGESNVLRIGSGTGTGTGNLSKSFISGIYGVTTTSATTSAVLVSDGDQLGTVSSSIRYKENVKEFDSSFVYDLKPIQFTYKSQPGKEVWYGLIAEDVYKVAPQLVNLDEEGRPDSIKYHLFETVLLQEIQKLKHEIEALKGK